LRAPILLLSAQEWLGRVARTRAAWLRLGYSLTLNIRCCPNPNPNVHNML